MASDRDDTRVRVGLLGVGLMGSAMAARMVEQGIEVIAWDRDAERVRALPGVQAADAPDVVASGVPVVISMLPTERIRNGIERDHDWKEQSCYFRCVYSPAGSAPGVCSRHAEVLWENKRRTGDCN